MCVNDFLDSRARKTYLCLWNASPISVDPEAMIERVADESTTAPKLDSGRRTESRTTAVPKVQTQKQRRPGVIVGEGLRATQAGSQDLPDVTLFASSRSLNHSKRHLAFYEPPKEKVARSAYWNG
jgi:hypothetical protein